MNKEGEENYYSSSPSFDLQRKSKPIRYKLFL